MFSPRLTLSPVVSCDFRFRHAFPRAPKAVPLSPQIPLVLFRSITSEPNKNLVLLMHWDCWTGIPVSVHVLSQMLGLPLPALVPGNQAQSLPPGPSGDAQC